MLKTKNLKDMVKLNLQSKSSIQMLTKVVILVEYTLEKPRSKFE